jgi:glycosyltransferase involved in cell wall biosynthesis
MHFTIITPSFNQIDYLRRCVASVRDQVMAGTAQSERGDPLSDAYPAAIDDQSLIHVHHHVQDGGSLDGTQEWLACFARQVGFQQTEAEKWKGYDCSSNDRCQQLFYTFSYESAPDNGMYEAINRGIAFASTRHLASDREEESQVSGCDDSITAWLNCDEQYLPGTLVKVANYFRNHPKVDFAYGNTLLLNASGHLLTYRKNPPLRRIYVQSDHLYIQSSSLFFRTKIFRDGHRFDTRWKAVSDCRFVLQLLEQGYRSGRIACYLSVFVITGENLSDQSVGWDELNELRQEMPVYCRKMHLVLRGMRYAEKWMVGGYRETFPLHYSIYLTGDPEQRTRISATDGTFRFVSWKRSSCV